MFFSSAGLHRAIHYLAGVVAWPGVSSALKARQFSGKNCVKAFQNCLLIALLIALSIYPTPQALLVCLGVGGPFGRRRLGARQLGAISQFIFIFQVMKNLFRLESSILM